MSDPGPPIAEVVGAAKRFPGVRALDDVSFTLIPGEVHALVGENGAGKSTLIKLLTGVYPPDSGEIRYAGAPVTFRRPLDAQAAGISTIYQEVNLVPLMSVANNLYLGREPRNRLGLIDFRRMHADAAALLRRYGIDVDVRRPLRSLGLGAQQMVALARAVSVNARAVIMDEPTSSLEPREVDTLFQVVRELREQGVAIAYVSHRLDELYRICDRVTVLRDGRVVRRTPRRGHRARRPARLRPVGDREGDRRRAAGQSRQRDGRRPAAAPPVARGGHSGRHQPATRGSQGRRHRARTVGTREHRARGDAATVARRRGVARPVGPHRRH